MRPTVKNIAAILRSHEGALLAQRITGHTPEQAAALLVKEMDNAPNARARDQIFSAAMAAAGVYTLGVEAFDKGTEEMLRSMGNDPARIEREAQRMSENSKRTPQYVTAERIKHVHQVALTSSVQQALADRMRERDKHDTEQTPDALPRNARAEHGREDSQDLRAAMHAAMSTASRDDGLVRLNSEHDSVRDSVRAAFETHEAIDEMRDPFGDPALLNMSDSV